MIPGIARAILWEMKPVFVRKTHLLECLYLELDDAYTATGHYDISFVAAAFVGSLKVQLKNHAIEFILIQASSKSRFHDFASESFLIVFQPRVAPELSVNY